MRPALANIITARVPEADLLIDTMTVRPQGNRAFLISDTIRRLKAADIWAKLDVLWMLAAHDAQAARLNWKAPASFALTAVNSPTFTADRGYLGNGTSSYLDTGYNPTTNAINLTQNSAMQVAYSRTAGLAGGNASRLGGVYTNGTFVGFALLMQTGGGNFESRTNDTDSGFANTTTNGWFGESRTSSTTKSSLVAGVLTGGRSVTSATRPNGNVYICASLIVGLLTQYGLAEVSAYMIGGGLTDAQMTANMSILDRYRVAVGA